MTEDKNLNEPEEKPEPREVALDALVSCNFCGATQEDKRFFIAGRNDAYICETCVFNCVDLIFKKVVEKIDMVRGVLNLSN